MVNALEILDANILIVDDQEINVTLLEQMLQEAGYSRVTSTMNPRSLTARSGKPPGVKVLDHFIVAPGACLSFAERGLL